MERRTARSVRRRSSCSTARPPTDSSACASFNAVGIEDAVRGCAAAGTARRRPPSTQRPSRERHAARLRSGLEAGIAEDAIRGIEFTQATQANAVFASLPPGIADRLRERARFYDWDASRGEVRWVCSFDTLQEDVDEFVAAVARVTASP